MKSVAAIGIAAALLLAAPLGSTALAQSAGGAIENGTVWRVSAVETKPGQFNAYMKYLASTWRAIQEAGIKRGDVVSYKVMVEDSPREHEANIYLLVEYKNMAVFDRALKDLDEQNATAFGSVDKAQDAAAAREAMRTPKGTDLLREVKFTH